MHLALRRRGPPWPRRTARETRCVSPSLQILVRSNDASGGAPFLLVHHVCLPLARLGPRHGLGTACRLSAPKTLACVSFSPHILYAGRWPPPDVCRRVTWCACVCVWPSVSRLRRVHLSWILQRAAGLIMHIVREFAGVAPKKRQSLSTSSSYFTLFISTGHTYFQGKFCHSLSPVFLACLSDLPIYSWLGCNLTLKSA